MTTQARIDLVAQASEDLGRLEDAAIASIELMIDRNLVALERRLSEIYRRVQREGVALSARSMASAILEELGASAYLLSPADLEQIYEDLIRQSQEAGIEGAIALIALLSIQPSDTDLPVANPSEPVERLRGWGVAFRSGLVAILTMAFTTGWGVRRMLTQAREEAGKLKGRAEQSVRTTSVEVWNDAADRQYQEVEIPYEQLVTAEDERVCPYCAARNMNIYRRGQISVPLHNWCRCLLVPVMDLPDNDRTATAYRESRLRGLKRSGQRPNYGASPAERRTGLDRAPSPVWTP
ncbi:MAG: minor capsid protein [Cyanobacteria bacterium J06638_20]